MSWTEPYDVSKSLKDDAGLCIAYSVEALVISAKKGIEYDVEPDTYIDKYFGGVQPTGAEFLQFLSKLGFDPKEIHESVLGIVERVSKLQVKARAKAATFFNLFQTEWQVSSDDVSKFIDEDSIYYLIELAVNNAATTRARLNAIKRHSEDPKQKDKAVVRECWDEWQKEPNRYSGKAAFARDMRDKFPSLESQPVIERWCREWGRKTITLPAQ